MADTLHEVEIVEQDKKRRESNGMSKITERTSTSRGFDSEEEQLPENSELKLEEDEKEEESAEFSLQDIYGLGSLGRLGGGDYENEDDEDEDEDSDDDFGNPYEDREMQMRRKKEKKNLHQKLKARQEYAVPIFKFTKEVVDFLMTVKQTGDFSEQGTFQSFINPGLEVDGVGMIGLPFSESQVPQLKMKFEKNSSSLSPSKFQLNPLFRMKILEQIQYKIQQSLGISNYKVHLELEKLSLLEKGSFSTKAKAKQQDSNSNKNNNGIVAKLIVLLPSSYEGGEMIIHHGNEKQSIDFSKQNKTNLAWIAYHVDCEYESLPLKSGYKLALNFNVCFSNPTDSSISTLINSDSISKFGKIMETWNKDPSMIGIRLSHDYPDFRINLTDLKDKDLTTLGALRTLSKHFPIDVHLVTIKKLTISGEEDYYTRHVTYKYVVDRWVNLENEVVPFGKLHIASSCLYPQDAFNTMMNFAAEEDDAECYARFPFFMIWPSSFGPSALSLNSNNLLELFNASLSEVKNIPFHRSNEKWKKLISLLGYVGNAHPDDVLKLLQIVNEIDSVEDPFGRKNTKKFISNANSISSTNSELISKLESFISQFGGWSQWKVSILALANNLEKPWALLVWILNDCSSARPTFIKTNQERDEIQTIAKELVRWKPIRPPMCLVISKLGDLSLACQMLTIFLEKAWLISYPKGSQSPYEPPNKLEMTFPHIMSMIQGFGFNQKLCNLVQKFFEEKIKTEKRSEKSWSKDNLVSMIKFLSQVKATDQGRTDHTAYAMWSMFFRQSSLRRLRLESAKSIVRFGRLVGTNKSISTKKMTVLKLVLNKAITASRLSEKETNDLINGSFNRSTLRKLSTPTTMTSFHTIEAPHFVQNAFVENYTNVSCFPKPYQMPYNVWDKPITCLNEDLMSDGPSGIGGVAKQKFAKLMLSVFFFKDQMTDQPMQLIRDLDGSRNRYLFLTYLSFAAYLNDWKKCKELLQHYFTVISKMEKNEDEDISITLNNFYPQFINVLITIARNFHQTTTTTITVSPKELNEYLKAAISMIPVQMRPDLLARFLANVPTKQNADLVIQMLSTGNIFWDLCEKSAPNMQPVLRILSRINSNNKTDYNDDLLFPLFEGKLTEFISNHGGILNRAVQIQLMALPNDKIHYVRWISTYAAQNFSKTSEESKVARKVSQFIFDQYFENLFPSQNEAHLVYEEYYDDNAFDEKEKEYQSQKQITLMPKRLENGDRIFRNIVDVYLDEFAKVEFHNHHSTSVFSIYATPEILRSSVKNGFLEPKGCLDIIASFIPHERLTFSQSNEPQHNAQQFRTWLFKSGLNTAPFEYQTHHEKFYFEVQKFRYFPFWSFSENLSPDGSRLIRLEKKWIPYLILKNDIENGTLKAEKKNKN